MNRFLLAGVGAVLATAAGHAQTYGSQSGYGNVLFPGTGHPPQIRTNVGPAYPGGFGTNVRTYAPPIVGPQVAHPNHSRRVVVPYPVVVGGYGGGYYGGGFDAFAPQPAYYPEQQGPQYAPQQAQPPVVIINQSYRPETANPVLHDYSDSNLPEPTLKSYDAPKYALPDPKEKAAARAESERPTIYLIAFKDHTILPALAYWIEGDTLNYVTKEGTPNRASLALVDKDFSRQLNKERSIDFTLP